MYNIGTRYALTVKKRLDRFLKTRQVCNISIHLLNSNLPLPANLCLLVYQHIDPLPISINDYYPTYMDSIYLYDAYDNSNTKTDNSIIE